MRLVVVVVCMYKSKGAGSSTIISKTCFGDFDARAATSARLDMYA